MPIINNVWRFYQGSYESGARHIGINIWQHEGCAFCISVSFWFWGFDVAYEDPTSMT